MSLISSTIDKVLAIAVGVLIIVSVTFGGLWWYRGTVIDSQEATIKEQAQAIEQFKKDKSAQAVADKQLKADKDKIAKERESFKEKLDEALKNNVCADTAIPDDAKRVLDDLYHSQGS